MKVPLSNFNIDNCSVRDIKLKKLIALGSGTVYYKTFNSTALFISKSHEVRVLQRGPELMRSSF